VVPVLDAAGAQTGIVLRLGDLPEEQSSELVGEWVRAAQDAAAAASASLSSGAGASDYERYVAAGLREHA